MLRVAGHEKSVVGGQQRFEGWPAGFGGRLGIGRGVDGGD